MEKLELKHLAPYLPYGLKVHDGVGNYFVKGYKDFKGEIRLKLLLRDEPIKETFYTPRIAVVKPILRPLSDLNKKQIEELAELIGVTRQRAKHISSINPEGLTVRVYNMLLENHYDVFGLIPRGLAADDKTIKT